ncbi:MAG: FAD-binding oxidoreductase, partial [Acetobacteraceae bacterium]
MNISVTENLKRPDPQALANTLERLAARFGNRLVTSQAVREQHAHTTTWLAPQPPDAVVVAQQTADIQDVVRICAANRVPVIAFGTGTSLEGQVNAPAGGVCIDLRDMNRVLDVHAEDLDCVIEPGVTRKALNEYLRDQGLFFPIDPGADASLGGMASTRASGTNAVRYGTIRENVLALKVVRADGEIIKTGTRAKKSSAGYDLTHLFIGAEGTLGIICELTMRLRGIPETIAAASCSFQSLRGACQAVILAIQTGIPLARIELLNTEQVKACNAYSRLTLPETPLLLLEFHGSAIEVGEQSKNFGEIAKECGGGDFTWTTRPEDRSKLWQARHDAYWAVKALRPGAGVVATDVCVPISRLADCVGETEEDLKRLELISPIVGHVGDGNFHCSVACDVNDHEEMARGEEFMHRLVERAQAMDGTCTGEHGIGQGKQKYLKAELGPQALD